MRHEPRETVWPLATEDISVSKRVVPKDQVQIAQVTRQREQLVDELLARENVAVERTVIGRPIDAIPAVREEGDVIVIPLVEEVLTIERRLVLKEEVRIRKVRETEHHQERVTLRQQDVVVTRFPSAGLGGGTDDVLVVKE
jgi:uncharacterized protein (TIGR02271 family)